MSSAYERASAFLDGVRHSRREIVSPEGVPLAVELAAAPHDAARLADQVEDVTGLSRIALGREVLRAPELLTLSPIVAIGVQLAMLAAFAPVQSTSLWTLDDAERNLLDCCALRDRSREDNAIPYELLLIRQIRADINPTQVVVNSDARRKLVFTEWV